MNYFFHIKYLNVLFEMNWKRDVISNVIYIQLKQVYFHKIYIYIYITLHLIHESIHNPHNNA